MVPIDHLGTAVGVADGAGSLVAAQRYWPYGATRSGSVTQTDKLYTGQQAEPGDAALGLYNYRARFYSTTTASFIAPDGYAPRDQTNRYVYVHGNPLRYIDPSGNAEVAPELQSNDALNSCRASPIGCLAWASGGNQLTYYSLVADYFGVSPSLLYAIVMNQSQSWELSPLSKLVPVFGGAFGTTPLGSMTFEDIQLALRSIFGGTSNSVGQPILKTILELIDTVAKMSGIDFENPSLGIAQVKLSTAKTLQDAGLAQAMSLDATVRSLLSFEGAVFFAGAYLHYLSVEIGSSASFDLIVAYRIGGPAFNVVKADPASTCSTCGPIARDEISKVYPHYLEALRRFGR